ncbi:MAG: DUF4956 domain-containing protein [Bacteroidales bacterium]|nr:DUF4956 domain-containing protein [Bacteroidales bacterium]
MLDILLQTAEDIKIFNFNLIDYNDFGKLLFRLTFNVAVLFVLIKLIYDKGTGRKEFVFTYFALGTAIFLLCYLLEGVKIELGFALGLFAVFGILKYRTDPVPIREMTYLFVVIGIAVVNALANKKVSFAELALTNGAILLCVYLLEKFLIRGEGHLEVVYERIENIKIQDRELLKQDVEKRTGLKIKRIDVVKVDFLKDTALIRVYYDKKTNNPQQAVESADTK